MSDEESEDAEFTGGEEEEGEGEVEEEEKGGQDEEGGDEEEPGNDSSDDEPLATSLGSRKAKRELSYVEDSDGDDDDDSEDDIPLAQLVKGKKAAKKKAEKSNGKKNGKKAKSSPAKKKAKAAATTKTPVASASATATDKSYEHASAAMYGTECDKGLLIQRLLCRWWYAYEWPTNVREEPPENYDPLDGFKGVFICTAGDDAGKILDTRDVATRPSFVNFARKPSSELQRMLLKAIDGQLAALEANKIHDTTSLQKELKEMRRWAARVNPDKADKEAEKVLKAARLKLPGIPGC